MAFYYYNDINFGDALNPLLFQDILPKSVFDEDSNEMTIGIGSILGLYKPTPNIKRVNVLSSGYAYGELPDIDERWNFVAVRGPLTAEALKLDSKTVVSDAGILSDKLISPQEKVYEYSFMPHFMSEESYTGWEKVCEDAGIHFISPTVTESNSLLHILEEISKSKVLITEAMHGAIIAESLRVPYIPVYFYSFINHFKWNDFGATVGHTYSFNKISSIYDKEFLGEKVRKKLGQLPKFLFDISWNMILKYKLCPEDAIKEKMHQLTTQGQQFLSDEVVLNSLKDELYDRFEKFSRTIKS